MWSLSNLTAILVVIILVSSTAINAFVVTLTEQNFEDELKKSELTLVKFYAQCEFRKSLSMFQVPFQLVIFLNADEIAVFFPLRQSFIHI